MELIIKKAKIRIIKKALKGICKNTAMKGAAN